MGEKVKLDKPLCRHAYSKSIECLARLASFSTSRNLSSIGDGEYYVILEDLFKSDILDISIAVRRLAELTQKEKILKSKNIKIVTFRDDRSSHKSVENIWNIIGNIIHGARIDVIKRRSFLRYKIEIIEMYNASLSTEEIDALVTIKSDKFSEKSFNLTELCAKLNEILDEINDFMGDNGLYFGSAYE